MPDNSGDADKPTLRETAGRWLFVQSAQVVISLLLFAACCWAGWYYMTVAMPRQGDRWEREIETCRAHVETIDAKHDAALDRLTVRIDELEKAIREK